MQTTVFSIRSAKGKNWGGWKTGCRYDKNRENSPGAAACGAAAVAVRLQRKKGVHFRQETKLPLKMNAIAHSLFNEVDDIMCIHGCQSSF